MQLFLRQSPRVARDAARSGEVKSHAGWTFVSPAMSVSANCHQIELLVMELRIRTQCNVAPE
jgi:hypothetical protein